LYVFAGAVKNLKYVLTDFNVYLAKCLLRLQHCTANDSKTMICRFPVIDVPHNFLPYLDSLDYVPLLPSNYSINKNYSTLDSPCPKYRKSSPDKSLKISFVAGFLLDGVRDFIDMGAINVFPPPNFCFNGTVITYQGKKMTVTVR
jgi:hypothetical protein